MTRTMLLLAAAMMFLPGCDRQGHQETAANQTGGQVDSAAEEQAIRSQNERWLQLIRAKDAAGIAELYAEDGAALPANEKIVQGRPAIQQWWGRWLAMPGYELTFQTDQLALSESGDMALDRGTYRFAAKPAEGAIEDSGKYVVVWRKVDGQWKVAADIFNSDRPAGG